MKMIIDITEEQAKAFSLALSNATDRDAGDGERWKSQELEDLEKLFDEAVAPANYEAKQ